MSTQGPIEAGVWPDRLPANVVSPGPSPRVRGYSPISDLAAHYDFIEFATIVLGARPPSEAWGAAANLATIALGVVSVADAPVHAATLAARFGSPARVTLAVGMLGLAEQASALLDGTVEEQPPSNELWDALPQVVRAEIGSPPSGQFDLALQVLRRAGLRSDAQLIALLCLARLPALAAEIDATATDLREYPMRLPDFEYQEDR